MMDRTAWILATAALALLALSPRPAHAEIGYCTVIDTLPTTIFTPGRYCLDQDIIGTYNGGYALRIYADDVVFDCADHRLVDSNADNTNTGVYVTGDHKDATIRNCVIDGFQTGILIQESADDSSRNHVIENNTVLRSRAVGISVSGSNMRIEGNRVLGNTGNQAGVAYGIRLYSSYGLGTGNTIRDNVIADFKPVPPAGCSTVIGISFFQVHATEVVGNTISGVYANTGCVAYPIDSSTADGSTLLDNRIFSASPLPAPLDGVQAVGIHLTGTPEQQATNTCRGNVVGHFSTTDIAGCTAVDNTEF
jgi:parallel beta-helix repeat protein